jgi:hypothetical protein
LIFLIESQVRRPPAAAANRQSMPTYQHFLPTSWPQDADIGADNADIAASLALPFPSQMVRSGARMNRKN